MLLFRPESSESVLSVRTPAKLNLYLDVLGKRDDGFHAIETVMCPITLWDEIEVRSVADGKLSLEVEIPESLQGDPAWDVPADSENLVMRAASLVQQHLGSSQGCHIRLKKQIPAVAGLGGGSGNAAGVVTACLLLWSEWNRDLALQLLQQIGSDVPFFLGGIEGFGLVHATVRGEQCRFLKMAPELRFWLSHPPQGCSTKEVYGRYEPVQNGREIADFLHACQTGQPQKIGACMFNALQSSAESLNGWIKKQLDLFHDCGFKYAMMSGSGSSCFALIDQPQHSLQLPHSARSVGLTRVFEVEAWYGPSIEEQISTW